MRGRLAVVILLIISSLCFTLSAAAAAVPYRVVFRQTAQIEHRDDGDAGASQPFAWSMASWPEIVPYDETYATSARRFNALSASMAADRISLTDLLINIYEYMPLNQPAFSTVHPWGEAVVKPTIGFVGSKLLSLCFELEFFAATAPHGYTSLTTLNWDMDAGTQLSLYSYTDDYQALWNDIKASVAIQLDLSSNPAYEDIFVTLDELLSGYDLLTHSYFTWQGLVICFDQSTIAPSAVGNVYILVPFDVIMPHMNSAGLALFEHAGSDQTIIGQGIDALVGYNVSVDRMNNDAGSVPGFNPILPDPMRTGDMDEFLKLLPPTSNAWVDPSETYR
ncbi:hypothetical protein AGMMS49992_04120 [Clostridia bacterium]|nr:hypothetical protein AGMMS49992_04120 [Clostridia bacterium]